MDETWDSESTRKIVVKAVARERWRVTHFHDLSNADLVHESLLRVRAAQANYRPGLGSWSHWCNVLASRAIMDIARSRSRAASRDVKYLAVHEDESCVIEDPLDAPGEEVFEGGVVMSSRDDGVSLTDWLRDVHQRAKSHASGRGQQGCRSFTKAQAAAVGLFMIRCELTQRDAARLFHDRPDLRRSVEFNVVPSHDWFGRARRQVRAKLAPARRGP